MKKSFRFLTVVVLVTAFFTIQSGYAQEVLFEDNFKTLDPAWGDGFVIKDGKAVLAPDLNGAKAWLNQANVFQDMTLSLQLRAASGDQDDNCVGGAIIWAIDRQNHYVINLSTSGKISVARLVNNHALHPIPQRDCPEVKKGVGQSNLLKIVVKGNQATINMNGKDVLTFKGQPPEAGGAIGLRAESADKTKAVWEFSDLKVTK
jgi:hypothetical protein